MSAGPYLRLVRAGTLFSPAADVIASFCIAGHGWSASEGRILTASVLLYAAGMILNDHADREIDAIHRPERPIPAGQIRPATALTLGLIFLATSLAISPIPLWHGAMAGLVLGYDYVIKRSAVAGALTMGTLRAMNLLTADAFLDTPTPGLYECAVAYFAYIVAVTFLGILEDAPRVNPRAVLGLAAVPPLAAALAVSHVAETLLAPSIAFGLAFVFLWRNRRITGDRAAIRGVMTWLLLGTMLYTGTLCLAAARPLEAGGILVLALLARRISRQIALT